MFTTLRHRNFALLWAGSLTSSLGSTMLIIALPFYVYARTGSTLATGAMFIAETVPSVLLGSVAGVFADRWDRRRTMVVADVTRAVLLLLLLTIPPRGGLWAIYSVAAAESAISQFFAPATGALLPRLVGNDSLLEANALTALSTNLTLLLAPPIGGALLSRLGLHSIVLADSVSYLVSGALIALIRVPPEASVSSVLAPEGISQVRRSVWRAWIEGLGSIFGDRTLAILMLVMGLSALAQGIFTVLLVPLSRTCCSGARSCSAGWPPPRLSAGYLVGSWWAGSAGRWRQSASLGWRF